MSGDFRESSGPTALVPTNGVRWVDGSYRLAPRPLDGWVAAARGEQLDAKESWLLRRWWRRLRDGHREMVDGRSESDLGQAGWAVVYPQGIDPAIPRALERLVSHRRGQATAVEPLFKELRGDEGLRPDETKDSFLARNGAGPGAVDPHNLPYYVLLVGSPAQIPFRFQYQLDVRYAVGRLDLGSPRAYARYADAVVAAETSSPSRSKPHLALFGPRNAEDSSTALSSRHLVRDLASKLASARPDWDVKSWVDHHATRDCLLSLLGGRDTPDLLLTATHGLWLQADSPQLHGLQGALLCQDWPGPTHRGRVADEWYVAGRDIAPQADLRGLISILFACYSGGTPRWDDFDQRPIPARTELAEQPFSAYLPQRLLSQGGLAVIAHIDQAWTSSFVWRGRPVMTTFEDLMGRLQRGLPVGLASEVLNRRYAELASSLHELREREALGLTSKKDETLVRLWTATQDARGFVVLGDPAVSVPNVARPD